MTSSEKIIASQWHDLLSSASNDARSMLRNIARQQAGVLSRLFYDSLLQDPQANAILSSEEVESRLSASLQQWLVDILSADPEQDIVNLIAQQRHIGVMHSRVNVTIELVLRGVRIIKLALMRALLHGPEYDPVSAEATCLAVGLIDIAIEAMSAAYSRSREKATRADEAFRGYAATVNMSLEREKQRAALFDWSNRLLQDMMISQDPMSLSRIGQSPFGFWLRHKAPALFADREQFADIGYRIDRIDRTLLPACQKAMSGAAEDLRGATRTIVAEVEQIRTLVEALFDHLVHLEAGRDAQTQLLNRRFLPTVLSREIELSRDMDSQFSVLLLDVDHFKNVNDTYGHDMGDRVLERVAQLLSDNTRSGDFAFRYGGEEFLLVCVEQTIDQAMRTAENIRQQIAAQAIQIPNQGTLSVTVSIGVAQHDGHPDYQRMIDRADEALYAAKNAGRNRCIAST
ncbi:GGDEF domain-containing protein [Rhizobium sp. KVB221]|uniref:Diguanylate cyclase DosC n=1 Tax=Rhizobium setariae TaxID=2801340 RepID=A0A937CR94_9HYPH|nr:GGDEF domain-containing protein [Rhizobium setariae]MBL0374137.1 GGDEF domain-containing protein [Rhizobium setariae]